MSSGGRRPLAHARGWSSACRLERVGALTLPTAWVPSLSHFVGEGRLAVGVSSAPSHASPGRGASGGPAASVSPSRAP